MQDASFITSDHGHARADKPRGTEAKTRRSCDGAWVKKGDKSVFWYKLHMKMDLNKKYRTRSLFYRNCCY
jgi:transposase, IS5 family